MYVVNHAAADKHTSDRARKGNAEESASAGTAIGRKFCAFAADCVCGQILVPTYMWRCIHLQSEIARYANHLPMAWFLEKVLIDFPGIRIIFSDKDKGIYSAEPWVGVHMWRSQPVPMREVL